MRPKGKLFALFAVFAAIGLVTASGAFTTVTAERTAEVTASGDADALLAIAAAEGDNGDEYVDTTSSASTVQLLLEGQGSSGINNNATTEVDNVLNITNQGSQDVRIYFVTEGQNNGVVEFRADDPDDDNENSINITQGSPTSSADGIKIGTGENATISMIMDTNDHDLNDGEEILETVTIRANATSSTTASP